MKLSFLMLFLHFRADFLEPEANPYGMLVLCMHHFLLFANSWSLIPSKIVLSPKREHHFRNLSFLTLFHFFS